MFKGIFVLSIGNLLEFYDFAVYGFLVGTLSPIFFPSSDNVASLIGGFGVFFVGFLARPIGAIFFGYIGDRKGRKKSLIFSIIVMATSTAFIGLLPTYETIGVFAPIFLILLRILQGFSLGGEFSGSLVTLAESNVSQKNRVLMSSIVTSAGVSGWFVGSLTCYLSSKLILPFSYWRIPFLLGALTGVVACYIRITISENFGLQNLSSNSKKISLLHLIRHYPKQVLFVISVGALMGCLFYGLYIFPNSFLPNTLNLTPSYVTKLTTFGVGLYMIFLPLMGWLGDKIGPKKLMLFSSLLCFFSSYFLFYCLYALGGRLIFIVEILSSFLLASFMAPATFIITQVFPKNIRVTGVSLSYNIGACFFGGASPMVFTFLIKKTSFLTIPWTYLAFCSFIAFISTLSISNSQVSAPSEETR